MSISIINHNTSGGLKPELIVQAPAQSTIDIIQNNIIIDTYTLGASETTHTFIVKLGTYTVQRTLEANSMSVEVIVDTVKQYTLDLRGVELKSFSEGSIVYLNESGVATPFYVAKHNYESGLNGTGRTLLVRQSAHSNRAWGSSSAGTWLSSACTVREWLGDTYKNMLDIEIQSAISSTEYYVASTLSSTTVSSYGSSIFLLSLTELGLSDSNAETEGTKVAIADTLRNYQQWTRSRRRQAVAGKAFSVTASGVAQNTSTSTSLPVRPCFTLPDTILVDGNNRIISS